MVVENNWNTWKTDYRACLLSLKQQWSDRRLQFFQRFKMVAVLRSLKSLDYNGIEFGQFRNLYLIKNTDLLDVCSSSRLEKLIYL